MEKFTVNEDYPKNLIREVFGVKEDIPLFDNPPKDWLASIEYVIHGLSEQEMDVLHYRYLYGMTYQEIGRSIGKSLERARQICRHAIWKLHLPSRIQYLELGVSGVIEKELKTNDDGWTAKARMVGQTNYPKTARSDIPQRMVDRQIEALDLSVRLFNILKRAGVDTVGDVYRAFRADRVRRFRNMGRRSEEELRSKMLEIGFTPNDLEPDQAAEQAYYEEIDKQRKARAITEQRKRDMQDAMSIRATRESAIMHELVAQVSADEEIIGASVSVKTPDGGCVVKHVHVRPKITGIAGNKVPERNPADVAAMMDSSIGVIGLSEPLREFLCREGLRTMRDVVTFIRELNSIPWVFEHEVDEKLRSFGLNDEELKVLKGRA